MGSISIGDRGQAFERPVLHIWESQRSLRVHAAQTSSSKIKLLKNWRWARDLLSSASWIRYYCPCALWPSSHIDLLIFPNISTASPRFYGNNEAISRQMRDAVIYHFPEAVIPIRGGPSECVERGMNVQRFEVSNTINGILFLLQSYEVCLLSALLLWDVAKRAFTTRSTSSLPRLTRSPPLKVF